MFYVYVLKSLSDNRLYVGKTNDLRERVNYHNSGKAAATKARRPLVLIYYEAFKNKRDAGREELFYKSGFGREALHSKLLYTLK